jgi:outer membrane lipoprotein-sorting protein
MIIKYTFSLIVLFICLKSISLAQQPVRPDEILQQAENKRMPWPQMSMEVILQDSIEVGAPGPANSVYSAYRVYFEKNRALVACLSPESQKGNLLLLIGGELWMYIHSMSQPVKMTALQRLFGSVSFLDIARLDWEQDYSIGSMEIVEYTPLVRSYLLHLTARFPNASYKKMDLWVDMKTKRPLKESIYLSEGKLYKTLFFESYAMLMGKDFNERIVFVDHFNKDKKSTAVFSHVRQEKQLPQSYFLKEKMPENSKMF